MNKTLVCLLVALMSTVMPAVVMAQEIKLTEEKVSQPFTEKRSVRFEIQYNISQSSAKKLDKLQLTSIVPQSIAGRQDLKVFIKPNPTKTWKENGVTYAMWEFVNPKKKIEIKMHVAGSIYRRDLFLMASNQTGKKVQLKLEEARNYLKEERCIYFKNNQVASIAKSIPNGKSQVETVKNIHAEVLKRMKNTGYLMDAKGANFAAKTGVGDCTEYSDLMVALCRAKGIPARVVAGLVTEWFDTPKHNWLEVHIDGLGWVPFDALHSETQAASFTSLQNKYIYLSHIRNDDHLKGYYYWCYVFWGKKPEIKATVHMLRADGQKDLPKKAEY